MATLLLALAALTCGAAVLFCVDLVAGGRTVPYLRDQPEATSGPTISVIVAARDEAAGIEAALVSVLAQRYPGFEVIAVDDRSTDATGAILDRLATGTPRLHVLHVTDLPAGWLGKNHALQCGAASATGEILLFTDADVVFDPSVLGRMVTAMQREGLDHLTVCPDVDSPTLPLDLAVTFFALWGCLLFRPWGAAEPGSRRHIGIGAFNAIRARLYDGFGGHSRIALRPDDDLKLGKLVKLAGGRQLVAIGAGMLSVRWYATLGELVRGLRKNAFSVVDYSTPLAGGAVIASLVINVWPFAALVLTSGVTWALNLVAAVAFMTMFALVARVGRGRPWLAFGYPIAAAILAYIVASATLRTLVRGGIEWRGTFYPLDALRGNVL